MLGLFVLFIGLMVTVRAIISSTQEVKASDLNLVLPQADHVNEDKDDPKFDTAKHWNDSNFKWDKRTANADGPVSDLVSSYKMTYCPYCTSAQRKVLVPLQVFYEKDAEKRKCPECGSQLEIPQSIDVIAMERRFFEEDKKAEAHELESKYVEEIAKNFRQDYNEEYKRMEEVAKKLHEAERKRLEKLEEERRREEEERRREEEKDKDDDGVDDEWESAHGMDPNDKHDILYDNDGDGFSNIFEIENKTLPDNPKSHPELWWRFQVKSIAKITLDIEFKALTDNDNDDKSTWMVQFNYPDPRRPGRITSRFLMIGQEIKIDNKNYRLVDIKRIITEKKREAGNLDSKEGIDRINESQAILLEVNPPAGKDPDRLVVTINKPATSNDKRPILVDSGNLNLKQREKVMRIGDEIRLGLFNRDSNKGEGSRMTAQERRRAVRVYKLISVDEDKVSVVLEDITPVENTKNGKGKKGGNDADNGKKDAASERKLIVVTRDGKVPKDRMPIKKVERSTNEEHDIE